MDKKRINDLSNYAVRVRYPGTEPTLEEARDAMEITKSIRKFARTYLDIKQK